MPSPRPRDQDVHQTDFVKERKRRFDFEEHFTEMKSIVPEVASYSSKSKEHGYH